MDYDNIDYIIEIIKENVPLIISVFSIILSTIGFIITNYKTKNRSKLK